MADDLEVRRDLVIPADELRETASRASGPGGQHVNKTSTRVTLRWNVASSGCYGEVRRARLLDRLGTRLTRTGDLIVHAGRMRSRTRNRELARERLAELVRDALRVRPARRKTKPTRASRERSLTAKQHRSKLKKQRSRIRGDD